MSRVVHFEIHADDPDRAAAFYTALLGWRVQKWDGPVEYWMLFTGAESEPGINGGLMRRRGPRPVGGEPTNAFVCTMGVADLDAATAKLAELGGAVCVPKMAVPTIGWLAYATDPEGNIFGLLQPDMAAA